MFDTERFIADCRAAFDADPTHKAVHEVVARAMGEPSAVLKALGEPRRPETRALYRSDKLTVLHVVWPPGYIVHPHDHHMWAVIGVYAGREDNVFWRRIPGERNRIEAAGAKALCARDTVPLGTDIIHSVVNPIDKLSAAIHVYGGDFFATERSGWDSLTLEEGRDDREKGRRNFERATALYEASLAGATG